MFRRVTRTLTIFAMSTLMLLVSGDSVNKDVVAMQKVTPIDSITKTPVFKIEEMKLDTKQIVKEKKKEYRTGWTTTSVNVRKGPSIDSDILDTYGFNTRVEYTDYNENWVEIKYKDGTVAYMCKDYISKEINSYKEYRVPNNSGFKSYMDYRCITSTTSKQYQLQHSTAYTGNYGIRQIDGRYCVAIGSHFTTEIGVYFDLILENGFVIPCVLADAKADKDTDNNNIVTEHNGCLSEFIVDTDSLFIEAKRMGDISYCRKEWNSPVDRIRVYN